MRFTTQVFAWLIAAAVAVAAGQEPAARPQRVDYLGRARLFAGAAGDEARLQKVIDICERALAEDPQHAEAMVWHGATAIVRAGQAFRKGDTASGQSLFARGMSEMTDATTLAPDKPGVLIPRGAVLLEATRSMPAETARPLLHSAVSNYEHVLELQRATFASLGDHAKGELLFGLADGWMRIGDTEKARAYFERLISEAPTSGQT